MLPPAYLFLEIRLIVPRAEIISYNGRFPIRRTLDTDEALAKLPLLSSDIPVLASWTATTEPSPRWPNSFGDPRGEKLVSFFLRLWLHGYPVCPMPQSLFTSCPRASEIPAFRQRHSPLPGLVGEEVRDPNPTPRGFETSFPLPTVGLGAPPRHMTLLCRAPINRVCPSRPNPDRHVRIRRRMKQVIPTGSMPPLGSWSTLLDTGVLRRRSTRGMGTRRLGSNRIRLRGCVRYAVGMGGLLAAMSTQCTPCSYGPGGSWAPTARLGSGSFACSWDG